jgi:putative transcriptional regulator
MNSTESFGRWLRRGREARNLTQEQLAELIGCSVETIRKIEEERRRPSRQMARLFAQCFDVPAEELPGLNWWAQPGWEEEGP